MLSKETVFMNFTRSLAGLSKCTERQVAAIITSFDLQQIYSIGINGGVTKGIDCLCALGSKYGCVHAEAQAIAKCMSNDPQKMMFITLAPCITCATLMINIGIKRVYYHEAWKSDEGLNLLKSAGIPTVKL